MSEENRESNQEQNPRITIEFDGIDSSVCRVTPVGVSLAQMELASFRLNTLTTRAVNDRFTAEVQNDKEKMQEAMRKQMQLNAILKDAKLKA